VCYGSGFDPREAHGDFISVLVNPMCEGGQRDFDLLKRCFNMGGACLLARTQRGERADLLLSQRPKACLRESDAPLHDIHGIEQPPIGRRDPPCAGHAPDEPHHRALPLSISGP